VLVNGLSTRYREFDPYLDLCKTLALRKASDENCSRRIAEKHFFLQLTHSSYHVQFEFVRTALLITAFNIVTGRDVNEAREQ